MGSTHGVRFSRAFESKPEILSPLQPPLCGQTACDNVELISQYNRATGSPPGEKVIRYRVVNIYDDKGLNPTVSEEQIRRQHEVLNEAFSRLQHQLAAERPPRPQLHPAPPHCAGEL